MKTNEQEFAVLADFQSSTNKVTQDKIIVETLKQYFPNDINETVYHFPFNYFYLATDKGSFFAIERKTKKKQTELEQQFQNKLTQVLVFEAVHKEVLNNEDTKLEH